MVEHRGTPWTSGPVVAGALRRPRWPVEVVERRQQVAGQRRGRSTCDRPRRSRSSALLVILEVGLRVLSRARLRRTAACRRPSSISGASSGTILVVARPDRSLSPSRIRSLARAHALTLVLHRGLKNSLDLVDETPFAPATHFCGPARPVRGTVPPAAWSGSAASRRGPGRAGRRAGRRGRSACPGRQPQHVAGLHAARQACLCGPSSVGTSIVPPRAAWLNVTGTWQIRFGPSRGRAGARGPG